MQTELDFLNEEFITYKCSRCRKEYKSMRLSLGTRTCPPCSNPEDSLPEPSDILAALENPRKDKE
jgi:Zn finger protein HypA/HybF involved in hydrogenase expression